jgi:fatty-acyl-CoA synthase
LKNVDLKGLLKHLQTNLPSYAVPLFLRIMPQIAVTATFKHQKGDLRNEGIDIGKIQEPLYYWDGPNGYVPLTKEVYAKITSPGARL